MTLNKIYQKSLFICSLVLFLVSGQMSFAKTKDPIDPLEPVNRVIFNFNDAVDRYFLKPLALLYNSIVPKPLAKGFSNFYANINTVPTILNDLLQANFYQAVNDSWRLGINSTFGLLGFFDVAQKIGLESNYEDFGLTLARWGYKKSIYIVIPFLGPATVRDLISFPINYYYLSIYPYINPVQYRYRLYFFGVLVRRADLLHYESVLQQLSLDPYIFTRDAYLQNRNYKIERNNELSDPYLNKIKLEENYDSKSSMEKNEREIQEETQPFADI